MIIEKFSCDFSRADACSQCWSNLLAKYTKIDDAVNKSGAGESLEDRVYKYMTKQKMKNQDWVWECH